MKLVFVSNGPLPYHTPILNELAKLADLQVIYMSRNHPLGGPASGGYQNLWGVEPRFKYSFHWSRAIRSAGGDWRAQYSLGVSLKLQRLRPDVVLFSSWGPLTVEPLIWKTVNRRKAVMWTESTAVSGQLRGRVSNSLRRATLARVNAFVASGSLATEYLLRLGVRGSMIVTSCLPSEPHGVDQGPRDGSDARREQATRFLFVGRLIERKRPIQMVEAFCDLLEKNPKARLTLIGDGPLLPAVKAAAARCEYAVDFGGRREGRDLAAVYSANDVLVVPSVREVWGLVVNEALAHGLYVVATDQVGSAHDLIDDDSGMIVPADDRPALVNAMEAATRLPRSHSAREGRRKRVEHCTPANFARDLCSAARIAVAGSATQCL